MMRALRYFFDEAVASLWRGYKTGEERGFWTGYNEACKDFKIGEWADQPEGETTDGKSE